jgi:hypothetical protein
MSEDSAGKFNQRRDRIGLAMPEVTQPLLVSDPEVFPDSAGGSRPRR